MFQSYSKLCWQCRTYFQGDWFSDRCSICMNREMTEKREEKMRELRRNQEQFVSRADSRYVPPAPRQVVEHVDPDYLEPVEEYHTPVSPVRNTVDNTGNVLARWILAAIIFSMIVICAVYSFSYDRTEKRGLDAALIRMDEIVGERDERNAQLADEAVKNARKLVEESQLKKGKIVDTNSEDDIEKLIKQKVKE